MKRGDAEKAIRSLVHDWAREHYRPASPEDFPRFSEFWSWLERVMPEATNFRGVERARDVAEHWFDEELGQTWRN
ncbi:hypothetical protein GVO57_09370 [Sphingomonas changnyeongensis]|uniref:Uncharacterized protein n=1 Tax=Sphingomonas changnyeongensis TaxID=2698679 RepID=A0A7Z2S833_9SPHN|nr:hypothetical protein GVO57_09370 [Sphingomonas changnyeongensis]